MKRVAATEQVRKELGELLRGAGLGGETAAEFASEFVRLAVRRLMQELLEAERTDFLGRAPWERKPGSRGYRNGYEPGKLKTVEGEIPIAVPQVRGSGTPFRSALRERLGDRTEVLKRLVVEAYARGLSTRDVEEALKTATGGAVLSRSGVSEVTEALWADYQEFQQRSLEEFEVVSLLLDGLWHALRARGKKREAVLCAWGILTDGRKVLLHMALGNKESEEDWLALIRNMVERGLQAPLTITADGAKGLINAIEQVWPKSLRIRCWVHKLRNIRAKLPSEVANEVLAEVYAIRDAGTHKQGRELAAAVIGRYESVYPSMTACLRDDLAASLNHLKLPARLRVLVRSSNGLERAFEEERRRSKIIPHFFAEKPCLKLMYAVLDRVSGHWARIRFTAAELEQLQTLRAALGLAPWQQQ
jgi:transposase-like protein